jgi:uncharacterized membrane protein YoaK (UPF0700 family)
VTTSRELGIAAKQAIALSLTIVGGFVDAVGSIALFQVFTANMSGNSVHVGMFLGSLDLVDLARPVCAIVAYVLGVVITRIVMELAARSDFQRIASFTMAAEALLLLLFARATPAMHLGTIVDLRSPAYFLLVALLAFAMGVQTGTLTHIGLLTVYTTFVTGTLTKFSESLVRALFWLWDEITAGSVSGSGLVRRATKQTDVRDTVFLASVWTCYVAGAVIGTVIKSHWELRALYLPVGVLLVFIVIDMVRPFGIQEERHQQGISAS